ncbi:flagellar motor protein MotB [Neolewinella xylanilytica]|uniref:Flagellar motor protein MotB n=1 Tax=Neolewinella xylanilytica TaxID=1514080 RepID=A0A2S6I808_9BACT|nr:OmpA family protein [Neolewinella xylanilytica]PPK87622.1 flagellar motor protein MotB [Neolewinella xylanilytica]
MRLLLTGLLALALAGCISPKKAAERYQPRIDTLDSLAAVQADSIYQLTLALERSRGGNDMLLETQNRLQDRLLEQDDRIEALQSNLSSTNSELNEQLENLREALERREANLDSLIALQAAIIDDYSSSLSAVANRLSDSLETKLDSGQYVILDRPGEVILSVQESSLFRPRSVGYLVDDAAAVLKTLAGTLGTNPLLKLQIVGHTDNQPNPIRNTDNWEYGALRAATLADKLATEYYISPNRITGATRGEYGPTQSNATEEGRYQNRRVEFVFTSNVANLLRELDRLTVQYQGTKR